MQPNTSLGARHHHTTLRVENNQSTRRPTSWSLSKLPVSGLYCKLSARGSTFLLDLQGTVGPIAGKTREKVELLSLSFLLLSLFPFLSSPSSYRIVCLNSSGMSSLATCHSSIGSLDYPYHLIHLPWISIQSCVATCLSWVPLELMFD